MKVLLRVGAALVVVDDFRVPSAYLRVVIPILTKKSFSVLELGISVLLLLASEVVIHAQVLGFGRQELLYKRLFDR